MKKKKIGLIFLEVFAILFFILYLSPLILLVINSAKSGSQIITNPLALPEDWGMLWKNITAVLTSPTVNYKSSFLSSTIITVGSLFTITFFGAMAGWALTRNKSKTSTVIYFMFVAAMVIPFQIVMFPLVSWFKTLSDAVTVPIFGFSLLRTYQGMIFAYLGFGMPMTVFMFSGFVKGIPYEIEEAARIDGCNQFQIFFHIILPMLKPIVVTVLILNGIWIWNDFLLPLLVLGKGNAIQTIPLAVSNFAGAYVKQWDMILTSTLLAIIPVLILFVLGQKHIIQGMTDGAVK
ncbi:carbohydrate ABC transporter permease [Erysipelothrix urinaevulpis]|uniref:carbohydrate ABC transporter permease n=1 Tax=Erysipelothrix urinaevulpis TaxID=2683717 RepID=UPI00135B16D4|nr:carbohydrate ABC transporter permease [Erysipelothrix urinaevulpis]